VVSCGQKETLWRVRLEVVKKICFPIINGTSYCRGPTNHTNKCSSSISISISQSTLDHHFDQVWSISEEFYQCLRLLHTVNINYSIAVQYTCAVYATSRINYGILLCIVIVLRDTRKKTCCFIYIVIIWVNDFSYITYKPET